MATIRYIDEESGEEYTVEATLADAPFDDHGKPASLLAIAVANGIEIEHACGGVCACSTCHVIVEEGTEHLSEATEDEEDMLDMAPGLTTRSRLSCQSEIQSDSTGFIVRIPSLNRNLVKE